MRDSAPMRIGPVLPVLLALLLPAAPASAATLLGNWFGTGQPDDRSEMYIDHFLSGGVFRAEHRWCRQGKAQDHLQTGRWSLAGDTLTIHVDMEGEMRVGRDDVYRIVSLDGQRQTSVYLPLNFSYKDTRVDDGFKMPDCDLTS
jgi:hypothetical protein